MRTHQNYMPLGTQKRKSPTPVPIVRRVPQKVRFPQPIQQPRFRRFTAPPGTPGSCGHLRDQLGNFPSCFRTHKQRVLSGLRHATPTKWLPPATWSTVAPNSGADPSKKSCRPYDVQPAIPRPRHREFVWFGRGSPPMHWHGGTCPEQFGTGACNSEARMDADSRRWAW